MKKEFYFICLFVICLFSCQGKKSESVVVEKDSITCEILQVKLSDNPTVIKEKLTNQGYHWEESEGSGGLCYIKVKGLFSFSGYYFENLNYCTFDAKIFMIHFDKECDSLVTAQKLYDEISKKIDAKYNKFKSDKLNDNFLSYVEYDDGKTNLSIGISHHEQEKIQWFFDEEDKHNAREYWSVILYYSPNKEAEEKNKNDF